MVIGSIALPGALVMINNDLTETTQNRLVIQLHIDEVISGQTFDLRLAADPNYPRNVRALRRRVMVVRNHQDTINRDEMDIVLFLKEGLVSVTRSCFGPPGQTFPFKYLYWGQLCIYHTVLDRSCNNTCGCACHSGGACSSNTGTYDGYANNCNTPYYPATYDPNHPQENHSYNQTTSGCGCGAPCGPIADKTLCGQYLCNEDGCIPLLDCRLVRE